MLLLLLLFLTFSVLVANPKKLLYTVANPARGLLNREHVHVFGMHGTTFSWHHRAPASAVDYYSL